MTIGVLTEMSSLHWKEIEIRYRGKPVKGRFNVSDKLVTVAAWNGTKTGQLGILPAERLAQMLLRELAAQGNKIGRRPPLALSRYHRCQRQKCSNGECHRENLLCVFPCLSN